MRKGIFIDWVYITAAEKEVSLIDQDFINGQKEDKIRKQAQQKPSQVYPEMSITYNKVGNIAQT